MNYGSDEDSKSKDEDTVTLKNGWTSGKDEDSESKDKDIVTLKNGWTSGKDEDSKSKDEDIVTLKNGWTSGKDEDSESKDEDLDWEVWFKPWILDSSFYNKKNLWNTSIFFFTKYQNIDFQMKTYFL